MNCLDCPHHQVINDPDPYDAFCDDDVAVLCHLAPREPNICSESRSDHFPYRAVTQSCRPYRLTKESEAPKWCPLVTKEAA